MKRILFLICVCCSFALNPSLFGQDAAQFAAANQAFKAGQFTEAINDYEALVRGGRWSANLFYNLGNAYFRSGDLGRAILNYERALMLEPHHPEAGANLRIARDEARALELISTPTERALRFMNLNQYAVIAAVSFWGAIFAFVFWWFARQRATAWIGLSILSLSIFVLTLAALISLKNGNKGHALAIVTDKEVQARVATADSANSVLALPPGSEIRVLSKRGDWIYAGLPNNLRGWISASSAENVAQ